MKKSISLFFCLLCSLLNAKTNPGPPYLNPSFDYLCIKAPAFEDNYPFDADGIFVLAQTRFRFTGVPDFNMYGAQSNIYGTTGDTATKHYGGDVLLNDSSLFYLNDSTYKAFGMDLSQNTSFTWKIITGDLMHQYTTTKALVNISGFNLGIIDTTLTRSNGFSFSHPTVSADSIVYVIGSGAQRVQKKKVTTSAEISFTSSDLLALSASDQGSFTVIVYNTMPVFLSGKKYYFQNNSIAVVGIPHVY